MTHPWIDWQNYNQGKADYFAGKARDQCPAHFTDRAAKCWRKGWDDARTIYLSSLDVTKEEQQRKERQV